MKRAVLCDWCLGRQFAFLGYGLSNQRRGEALKLLLLLVAAETYEKNADKGITRVKLLAERGRFVPARQLLEKEGITDLPPIQPCDICQGVMDRLGEAADAATQALQGWEAASILIGTKLAPEFVEREEQLRGQLQIETGEPLKADLNREIGKLVTERVGLPADFTSPDLVVVLHIPAFTAELQVNSLFIYGRYQKHLRGIPQTKWTCRECGGKGCPRCKGTGKMYPESVEELIAAPLLRVTKGTDVRFHGAGREDIDARMLGEGRPFVIEVMSPRHRTINLKTITNRINRLAEGKVAVAELRFANKELVKRLKASSSTSKKVYKAIVQVSTPVRREELLPLESLPMPLEVKQRTPQRVLHRRADRLRRKRVFALQVTPQDEHTFELTIQCQGGLYVKEFVSGDEGRTIPSITEILGKPAVCQQLDVLNVAVPEEEAW
jgi:tRNA pseudouridine synthase 10